MANAPFLQDGVAEGEVVRFVTDADGLHWAKEQVETSGNCTVRVLTVPSGPLGRSAGAVHERLSPFGLAGEVFSEEFPLVALPCRPRQTSAALRRCSSGAGTTGGGTSKSPAPPMRGATRRPGAPSRTGALGLQHVARRLVPGVDARQIPSQLHRAERQPALPVQASGFTTGRDHGRASGCAFIAPAGPSCSTACRARTGRAYPS